MWTRLLLSFVILCVAYGQFSLVDAVSCTVTNYADVAAAAASCDTLTIGDLEIPAKTTLEIQLKDGAHLIFDGHLTHKVATGWSSDLVHIRGKNVEITGTDNHLIDGMGPQHWNGGNEETDLRPKFVRFYVTDSQIRNLKLKNCPNLCFLMSSCENVLVRNIHIDNYDGYPGVAPAGKFAKNTDGFDISGGNNITIQGCKVVNQDDCVAITGGSNYVFDGLQCNGSHGLSFSVSKGDVHDVQFINSIVKNANLAIHVKTHNNVDSTGTIRNVLYKNITISGIDKYGVSIQQNYPSGTAKGNVPITNLTIQDVVGTMKGSNSVALQIVCAKGACSNWSFSNVKITGAKKSNICENVPSGISC